MMDSNDPQNTDGDISCGSNTCSWPNLLCNLIEKELQHHGLTYTDLTQKLRDLGIADYSEKCLKHKIRRGNFSAAFLIQILCGPGCERVDIGKFAALRERMDDK